MLTRLVISYLFVFLTTILYSQTPRFSPINVSNGLSDNIVFSIEIDSTGDIWFGTNNGLNQFNGFDFQTHTPNNDINNISSQCITALAAGNEGGVWALVFGEGINYVNPNENIYLNYTDSLLLKFIAENAGTIFLTNDSLIWIHSNNKFGLYNLQTNKFQILDKQFKSNGICRSEFNDILYYGEFGIRSVMPQKDKIVFDKKLSIPVYYVLPTSAGYVVSTSNAIIQLNNNFVIKDTLSLDESDLLYQYVNSMVMSDKYMWIGLLWGLHRMPIKKDTLTGFLSKQGPISPSYLDEHITGLKIDKAGNLWIGTPEKGVFVYSKTQEPFQFVNWSFSPNTNTDVKPQIQSDPVLSICKTHKGELFLGSSKSGIGIIKPDGTGKVYYTAIDELGNEISIQIVRCIFEDSYNTIWISTQRGTLYYNRIRDRIETINRKYKWKWPYSGSVIKEFKPGILTITGDNLIGEVNLKTGNLIILPLNVNGVELWRYTRDMALDNRHNLWLIQNNRGLVKIDSSRNNYTLYTKETSGFSSQKMYALHIQGDSIWLASKSGLNLFSIKEEKVIKLFTTKNGLSSNIIYSVFLDNANNLWMSTSKGISQLNLNKGTINNYLNNTTFHNHAYYFNNNTIYYGGYSGVVQFNPSNIKSIKHHSNPVIDEFWLFNKRINIGDTVNGKIVFTDRISETTEIKLSHKQNSFSLAFNAYPFTYPNTIHFRYRLKGTQLGWVESTGAVRKASYTELKHGTYTFQVSASGHADGWSQPAEIKIIIKPPFWRQAWFIIGVGTLIVALVLLYIRLRLISIKRRSLWLEQQVEEKTYELKRQNKEIKEISEKLHEADQSKLRFFTNVSHEFRTPLTIILGHLDKLVDSKQHRSKNIIRNNVYRLLDLVNQLIEIRKMDQDQLKLHVSKFDLIEFCHTIINSFQIIAEGKDIQLQFYSEHDKLDVWLDKDKTEKSLYNLISNAIKYSPNQSSVTVSVQEKATDIYILIEDEGIGISQEDLDHVFDRFYRSKEHGETGHGIGLALTKGLIEKQGGEIFVTSKINEGTLFTLKFKAGKNHFTEDAFGTIKSEVGFIDQPELLRENTVLHIAEHKILLVEDNIELSNYIIELLQPKFTIRRAANGAEALAMLNDFIPDLIISDILMPVMGGIQFCTQIKADIKTSHIPVVLLTAITDSQVQIEGFNIGIDDYIEKPFVPDVLIARIVTLLSNREKLKEYFNNYNLNDIANPPALSKRDQELWNKINAIITKKYSDPDFNSSVLCELVNMSRSSLYRKFKELTGINVAEHIRKYRLHKAAELIREGDSNITYLSLNVGFKSVTQFGANFKEEFGVKPTEYINQVRK